MQDIADYQRLAAAALEESVDWPLEQCPVILADALSTSSRVEQALARASGLAAVVYRPRLTYAGRDAAGACAWDIEDMQVDIYTSAAGRATDAGDDVPDCMELALLAADIIVSTTGGALTPTTITEEADEASGLSAAHLSLTATTTH